MDVDGVMSTFRGSEVSDMAMFYGINSSTANAMFSSLNTSYTNKTTGYGDLTGLLSDYSIIKSGGYKKLLTAYYSETGNKGVEALTTSTEKDSQKMLAGMKNAADGLGDSADKLADTSSKSVFEKVKQTDKEGKTTYAYDKDAIYKSVKDFVDDYNELVEATEKSNTESIASKMTSIINMTKATDSLLEDIGITINSDFTLDIDEEKFKDSEVSTVKSLFNGRGSYGYQIGARADMVSINAKSESLRANTYTSSAVYSSNYSSGGIYSFWA